MAVVAGNTTLKNPDSIDRGLLSIPGAKLATLLSLTVTHPSAPGRNWTAAAAPLAAGLAARSAALDGALSGENAAERCSPDVNLEQAETRDPARDNRV